MNLEATTSKLTAYIAVIVFEYTYEHTSYQPLYDESFVLIKAYSLENAQLEVLAYAQKQQVTYKNQQQETVHVSLKQVIDVSPLLTENIKFENGSELYSRHFRDYQAYVSFEPLLSGGL